MGWFCLSNFLALISIILAGPTTTSGAAVSVVPQASSDGLCYKYVVQAGETCSMIAQAHSITVADIETYNARSWKWPGCGQIPQGTFICLSAGEPIMPVALPNAVCGPQVPGTIPPNNWSDLGSLNPCAANECCSSWGLCGTTPDFCTSAAHPTAALSKSTGTHPNKETAPSKKTTTSTGTTKLVQQFVASSETPSNSRAISTSATKSVPTLKSTSTTIKTTSSKATLPKPAKPSKTASITSTKSSQSKTSTSTKRPAPADPWSLRMYSKKDCAGDYLLIGYRNDTSIEKKNTEAETDL
ncbi:hypothetical protein N7530_008314 [Penicillium desertorum]|uniref:LysM domain-containing protein n=1 Tax=Penicillium desertorum TaxID=1303715 RepID=A0A9W9WPN5_9EURO|nr:hypothetical protein N7530_008314 [Penicillium desertorum]